MKRSTFPVFFCVMLSILALLGCLASFAHAQSTPQTTDPTQAQLDQINTDWQSLVTAVSADTAAQQAIATATAAVAQAQSSLVLATSAQQGAGAAVAAAVTQIQNDVELLTAAQTQAVTLMKIKAMPLKSFLKKPLAGRSASHSHAGRLGSLAEPGRVQLIALCQRSVRSCRAAPRSSAGDFATVKPVNHGRR